MKRYTLSFFLFLTLLFIYALFSLFRSLEIPFSVSPPALVPDATGGRLLSGFLPEMPTDMVHAVSAVALGNDLLAFWYGGSREATHDVTIYSCRYTEETHSWGRPQILLTPAEASRGTGRYIHILGNPAAILTGEGTLALFFVSVSGGGWSASAVNVMLSKDEGTTWTRPQQVVSSPFWNISTLVKTPPFELEGGKVAVPVYHEFMRHYGELLIFDRDWELSGLQKLSRGVDVIQPQVFLKSSRESRVYFRTMDRNFRQILQTSSSDRGKTWSPLAPTGLSNPSAAVAGLVVNNDRWLLIYNHSQVDRQRLDLAVSDDFGETWSRPFTLETAKRGAVSYPWILSTGNGKIHLFYTWNRKNFRHLQFDVNWVQGVIP
jgi:predicted neuraminidase